jgi:branched-chain amino acid transport system ATP-binding protein
MAMVIVDKNFAMLSELADRCVILVKGRKVFDAAPGVLAAEPGLRERYLGV